MDTDLKKARKGRKLIHDFSKLAIGEAIPFKGPAKLNPYPYASRWNKNSKIKIEVWRDEKSRPYAKRVA